MLSALYAAVARRRREWYATRPERRQRLKRPVVSIGNLAVGGRGKTPLTASVARILTGLGEVPAILSRGYGRAIPDKDVVVVRDRTGIRADLGRAGDEPLVLARQLPGVPVLVCADRYRAGRFAEDHLGATVHVLDDGFQHLQLDRDLDLVIVGREDIAHPVTLPGGRLREPLDTLIAADAVLAEDDVVIESAGFDLPVYRIRRETPTDRGATVAAAGGRPVVAVAGIASPGRFFADLRQGGWTVAATMVFKDHHRFTSRDVERMALAARTAGAALVVTTEKDYVRLLPFEPWPLPIVFVPMAVRPEPFDRFREWIGAELLSVRGSA